MLDVRIRRVAAIVVVVALAATIGLPLVRLLGVVADAGPDGLAAALRGPLAAGAIANSLWVSAAIAAVGVTTGTAAAFVTERLATRGRAVLRIGILLPLLVPPFVLAFGWARAFGPRGLLDQAAGVELPGLYGPLGIILVVGGAATPLAWLVVAAALASRAESELEQAARASGAGPWTTFRTVTLPLLRPALLAAGALTFVYGMNAFGVPAILGTPAGFATITTRLYQDLALSADPAAFARATALAATLVVLALAVIGSAELLLGSRPTRRTGQTPALAPTGGAGRWPAMLLGLGIAVATLVPLAAVLLTSLTRAVGLAPVPANWTLDNFGLAVADGRFGGALIRSLVLGAAAATIVLVLGVVVAVGLRGSRARIGATALTVGFAIPGSALAVAVLIGYGGPLRNTLLIILVAYVAKFWALGHRQLAGSVDRLPDDLWRAARASGAGSWTAARTVAMPLLRPAIVAAWVVVFVFGLHEITMSTLLYGPGTSTLAVHVLNVQQLGDPTVTAALAVLLTALVAIAALPLLLIGRGSGAAQPTWQAG